MACAELGSPLRVAIDGAAGSYRPVEVILVRQLDMLRRISWQLAGDRTVPPPKPTRITGVGDDDQHRFGSDPIPAGDFLDWWESR